LGHKGKLGTMICEELETNNIEYDIIDRSFNLIYINNRSIVVDVSSADGTTTLLTKLMNSNIYPTVIIGTTGELPDKLINDYNKLEKIIKIPNFSIGCSYIFEILSKLDNDYWISSEILDIHHINKKDSPSGTAIKLSDKIKESTGLSSTIISRRESDIIGTHIIELKSKFENITIVHEVLDRRVFAMGCINIINHLLNQ
jgi:4-hydroxy-tetrahydrodipicolinate reductase